MGRAPGTLAGVRRLRVGVIIGVLGIVLLSGCGSRTPAAPSKPLASALAYFPAQSPVIATVQTAPHSATGRSMQALQRRFPFLTLARVAAMAQLRKLGLDYTRDLKPLFGNPIVIGSSAGGVSHLRASLLAAWVTRSAAAVTHLLHLIPALHRDGARDGATLYSLPSLEVAVRGPVVVLGLSRDTVLQALDRHARGAGMTPQQATAALPHTAAPPALEVFGDLQTILTSPGAAKAKTIPWVAAARTYGVSFGATANALDFDFRIATDPSALSPAQLPIAAGTRSPGVVGGLPVQAALRDPAQVANFVLAAIRAAAPGQYARTLRELAATRRRTGVDVLSLAGQLTGDLVVDSDSRTTLIRAGLGDPPVVSAALAKLAGRRNALGTGTTLERAGSGTYAIPSHGRRALIAVIGRSLVAALPPRGQAVGASALTHFAQAPATAVPGASGSLVFRIAINQLVAIASPNAMRSPIAAQLLGLLGDLSGSVSATPSALTGHASLGVR